MSDGIISPNPNDLRRWDRHYAAVRGWDQDGQGWRGIDAHVEDLPGVEWSLSVYDRRLVDPVSSQSAAVILAEIRERLNEYIATPKVGIWTSLVDVVLPAAVPTWVTDWIDVAPYRYWGLWVHNTGVLNPITAGAMYFAALADGSLPTFPCGAEIGIPIGAGSAVYYGRAGGGNEDVYKPGRASLGARLVMTSALGTTVRGYLIGER